MAARAPGTASLGGMTLGGVQFPERGHAGGWSAWPEPRRSGSTAAVLRSWARRARASSSTSAAMRSMTARTRARSTATTARSGQPADGRRLTAWRCGP